MSRFVTYLRESFAFVRDYTAGVGSRDLERMFRRDAPEAYAVLTRSQERVPDDAKGLKAGLRRLRVFLLGLSYTLSPPRRMLFALAMVLAVVDTCVLDFSVEHGFERFGIDVSPATVAVVALVFLLALELVDRVRVRDELEVARDLQRQLLPATGPALPGYGFAQSYRTANEIGGDYYDFLTLPDGRLVIAAADASGHGMAAGLLMVIAHATLRLAAEHDPRPASAVALLNKALCGTGGPRAFLTLFYAVLDPETGRLDSVCAGHPFPLLRRRSGAIEELGAGSLPLGLRRDLTFDTRTTTLEPGDLLLVYSDGLPEAVHPTTGATFGFARMKELLAPGGTAEAVHARIVQAFDAFLAGEAQEDDISLVVVARKLNSQARAEPRAS